MASKLTDIHPGQNELGEGVSLVHRGANRRRFLLAKSDELDTDVAEILAVPVAKEAALLDAVRASGGDESVEKAAATVARAHAALTDAYSDATPEQRAALAKAVGELMSDEPDDDEPDVDVDEDNDEKVMKAYEEIVKSFTAEQRQEMARSGEALTDGSYPIPDREYLERAIHAVGRGKNNSHGAIRAHIVKRAKALGAESLLPDTWEDVTKEADMPETETTVPIKKDDGTWDLSGVPEEQRTAFEAILKSHDDELAELRKQAEVEQTKAEEALKIAKAEQETRLTREFVEKSAGLAQLAKSDDEFGVVLRDIAKAEQDGHLAEGTYAKLETVLKAANEQIEKGDLYAETGRTGTTAGAGDAQARLDSAAAELRKSDSNLTKAQSVAKALENDPSLYTAIKKEQG